MAVPATCSANHENSLALGSRLTSGLDPDVAETENGRIHRPFTVEQ